MRALTPRHGRDGMHGAQVIENAQQMMFHHARRSFRQNVFALQYRLVLRIARRVMLKPLLAAL